MAHKGRTTKEDYAKHYREYQGTPAQIKARAERNKARALMEKDGRVHKGDGKDVHHKRSLMAGGTSARSNLAVVSEAKNRASKKKRR